MNKLLLVDDEPDILRVLSMSLKADGYDVKTASSGKDALTVFSQEKPDIVITDIKMPGMNGIEVLREVKKIDEETEVIIITGHGDIDAAIEALKYGASDFINKPVRDEALSIALNRAHEKIDIKNQLKEYTVGLEHKVAEATREVRRKSNFQSKLITSSYEGIVATDKNMDVVIYNPGAEAIFGFPVSDVIEKMNLLELLPQNIAHLFETVMEADDEKKEIPWQETTIMNRGGEAIPVRISGSTLHEKGRKMGSVTFFQDLREVKRLERELLKAERLAAIGQTVAGLSHGLKNILHGLKGGSYLVDLGIKKDDTEKLKSGWDMIKRNIGRTSEMVLDLLTYSKEREPEFEDSFPNDIAKDVCDLMYQRAQENRVNIVKDFDPSLGKASLDPRTLHTALLNLMTNAIDACLFDIDTNKNWQVILKTDHETENSIRFDVTDNGAGMNAEVKEKLFTSFFSTKGHRGTGLGLMVTRKLIEEQGGEISVTSEPSVGTTFTIRLPYRAPERE
jgi:PAS domain S-box-containing protein